MNKADKEHFHSSDSDRVLIRFLNLDAQDWSRARLPMYRPAPNYPVHQVLDSTGCKKSDSLNDVRLVVVRRAEGPKLLTTVASFKVEG